MRKVSYGSVTAFWLDRAEAVERLRRAAERLVGAEPAVVAVYLFGSLADGRAVPGSDADILVILRHSVDRWMDRSLPFAPYFADCGIGVELFCYVEDEIPRVPLAVRARATGMHLVGEP